MIPFGSYFLVQRLAVGGMAEVFLATRRDAPEGGLLVIKRILPHLQAKADFLQMFLDETELTSRLHHPNLVRFQDHGEAEGIHFIAMEHVDGLSLSGVQKTQGGRALDHSLACWVIAEVCQGLAYAHALKDDAAQPLGVVHRDISPDNILLSRDGEVKLADFGVAKAALRVSQTQPGTLKGKLSYMSPEQGMRLKVDRRSDVFSLGIVLYELTTGKRLFEANNELEVRRALYQHEYTPPEQVVEGYPPRLAEIMSKALQWDPEARFADALRLREALQAYIPAGSDPPGELAVLVRRLCQRQPEVTQRAQRATADPAPTPSPAAIINHKGETILGVGEVQRVLANYSAGKAGRETLEVPEMANATIEEPAPSWDPSRADVAAAGGAEGDTLRDLAGSEHDPVTAPGADALEEELDTVPRLISLDERRASGSAEASAADLQRGAPAQAYPVEQEEGLSDSGFQPVRRGGPPRERVLGRGALKGGGQGLWLLAALTAAALALLVVIISLALC